MDSAEKLYGVIPQVASQGWLDKKCYWCGEYLKHGEKLVLVIPAFEYKKQYKKLSSNVVMHEDEFNALVEDMFGDQKKVVIALALHKQKRVKDELTEDQKKEIEAFTKACWEYGFHLRTDTKDEIHMRKNRTSLIMCYNPRSKRMHLSSKIRKRGMFDGFYEQEIVTKVFNKMQEILGTGIKDEYTAAGSIKKVFSEVDKMFGK